jgi:hypothetical protein
MLHSKESADGSKGAYIEATSEHRTIYEVSADNYIRNGSNASKTYNYENITSAHGSQYVGKNYKVLNTKYDGSTFIATVMKLSLPSKEEVEAKGLNQSFCNSLFDFDILFIFDLFVFFFRNFNL